MDKHYLTPLFLPQSIVVFAGPSDEPDRQTPQARALRAALQESPGPHPVQFLDVDTTGTLGRWPSRVRSLAIIALPADELPAALEVAGRIACRSALIISTGVDADAPSVTSRASSTSNTSRSFASTTGAGSRLSMSTAPS